MSIFRLAVVIISFTTILTSSYLQFYGIISPKIAILISAPAGVLLGISLALKNNATNVATYQKYCD